MLKSIMINCPLCHSVNTHLNGWGSGDLLYRECRDCKFIFLPRPIPIAFEEIYNEDYARLRGHDDINSPVHSSKLRTAEFYFKKFNRYITFGKMLDIGCSTGANVAKACELGWEAFGMDINESSLAVARSYIPKAKFFSSLDAPEIKGNKFKLITLFDVIEHVEDLHDFIRKVYPFLDEGGIIFMLTPDGQSLSAQWMKNQWPHLFNEHISLFSRANLAKFLKGHHFEVLESGFAWKFVSWQGLYLHAQCHFHSGPILKAIKSLLSSFKDSSWIFPFNIGESYIIAKKP